MKKEKLTKTIKEMCIIRDGKYYVMVNILTSILNINYQNYLNYFREFNTDGKIQYLKIGINKMMEVNDLFIDITYNFMVRDEAIKNLEEYKKQLKTT